MPAVTAVLCDITGVLYEFGSADDQGVAVPGAVHALQRLESSGVPYVLLSNTSTCTAAALSHKLQTLGFAPTVADRVLTPVESARQYLADHQLRPHALVHHNVRAAFADVAAAEDEDGDCVLLGDAMEGLGWHNLNQALRLLLNRPLLITLGNSRIYHSTSGVCLNVGSYAQLLRSACEAAGVQLQHVVIGKPTAAYYQAACSKLNVNPQQVLMLGDDIESDVAGAQRCGLQAALCCTGKARYTTSAHPTVAPDFTFASVVEAVDYILTQQKEPC